MTSNQKNNKHKRQARCLPFNLYKMQIKCEKGFTLIEIMIVVAITSILGIIAIPQYKRFQMKCKQVEVYINFGTFLKTCEESFKAEHGSYLGVSQPEPNAATLGSSKHTWTDNGDNNGFRDGDGIGDFAELGFIPSGAVYAKYYVSVGETNNNPNSRINGGDFQDYCLEAATDLDNDGTNCEYALWPDANQNNTIVQPTTLATNITLGANDAGRVVKGADDF